jgi:hypothetical protein
MSSSNGFLNEGRKRLVKMSMTAERNPSSCKIPATTWWNPMDIANGMRRGEFREVSEWQGEVDFRGV